MHDLERREPLGDERGRRARVRRRRARRVEAVRPRQQHEALIGQHEVVERARAGGRAADRRDVGAPRPGPRGTSGSSTGEVPPRRSGGCVRRRRLAGCHGVARLPARRQDGSAAQTARRWRMRIGVLTGGGDCPGLNAVIRAVVRKGEGVYGHNLVGFRHGWRGVVEGETVDLTTANDPRDPAPGRHDPRQRPGPTRTTATTAWPGCSTRSRRERIDALIAIGGEDTLGVARKLGGRRRAASSASRRRSTTTSPPPTSRSASTPRCRSPRTRSTGCTRRRRATTA